ncbi:MAG: HEAT repeat domain-containing protein [Pseudomonadales bacterium]|nr:HEAT repeat domain-containing protein [Pseudomonadales bacterium]
MTDAALPRGAQYSLAGKLLVKLGIRPEENTVVALLFSNMFMSGIATGMIRICAYTLFLEKFGSEKLALVAILLAVTGTVVTLLIDRLTHRLSVAGYIYTILGTVIGGLLIFRVILGITEVPSVIFFLPLFFEIAYMLFSLQFLALLSRLLDVRQSKRLAGVARSGEFLAEMVGGLAVALLLKFMNVVDLLLVAIVATLFVGVVIQVTVRRFSGKLILTSEDLAEDENQSRLLGMLRLPYVRLISLCYAAYIFAYFFLDVAFYRYASIQFPDQRMLAEFLGKFFAGTGVVTLLVMVFAFAPFLRRFGILAGVLAFPIVIATGSMTVSMLELSGAEIFVVFVVMAATNGARFVLQSAIWRPSVSILFQVLPDRQRTQGSSLIEGVIDPFAGGVAGLTLYFLSSYLHWEPQIFLMLLSAIMVAWIATGVVIRRMYLSHLVVSIQKRKLGELSLKDLDNASLDIIKEGLKSPYPAEIFYCLNILEELEHPEITELLKQVVASADRDVRMDVLRRIARLHIEPLTQRVNERIEAEDDPEVRGQALKTYAALGAEDTEEKLTPFLDSSERALSEGALVGLLTYDPRNDAALDYLLGQVRAGSSADRKFAAAILGEVGKPTFSGFLVELLDDRDSDVVNEAILAASRIKDPRLINILVSKISMPKLQGRAALALQSFGEQALYDLDLALTAPTASRRVKRQIVDIVREIGGEKAIEILLRHIDIEPPGLRHQVYLGLAMLHYQADPDDQYVFVNRLEEEVQQITWLLAAMEDLYRATRYHGLTAALGQELDQHRDNMLLLISFLFPSIVMLDTRANIDSKVSELRTFALEVLDNLLTTEIKQVVIPILDDLTVSERLSHLAMRYPQPKLEPDARFDKQVSQHFNDSSFWTKACLLHLIGQRRTTEHLPVVEQALEDPEPIVRETANWALAQLQPPELKRMLTARADDPDDSVRHVVRGLLAMLPA